MFAGGLFGSSRAGGAGRGRQDWLGAEVGAAGPQAPTPKPSARVAWRSGWLEGRREGRGVWPDRIELGVRSPDGEPWPRRPPWCSAVFGLGRAGRRFRKR